MAKQVGPLFITGTIDGIIFYKLNGQYYMRSKGDYRSGKQMRKDPRLKRSCHLKVHKSDSAHLKLCGSEQKCNHTVKMVTQVLEGAKHPSSVSLHGTISPGDTT